MVIFVIYIGNAFSTKMLDAPQTVKFEEVTEDEFNKVKTTATSAVGHQNTANVLGVKMNRISLKLKENDVLYVAELRDVAELQGGRLPEGVTTLPDDFAFKYIKCEIL